MIELQPSIGFLAPDLSSGIPTGKSKRTPMNPLPSWDNYRNKNFNTIHFSKERKKITSLDFQILIQMLISNRLLGDFVGKEEEIMQHYAMVLTIKDKSKSGSLRSEILGSNQFFELVENVVSLQNY